MHEILVNCVGSPSLPRKSLIRLTDCPNMTMAVYRGFKTTTQQQYNGVKVIMVMWPKSLISISFPKPLVQCRYNLRHVFQEMCEIIEIGDTLIKVQRMTLTICTHKFSCTY